MTRPISVIESSAELGGAELSILPAIARLAERHRVVVLLPASGPMEEAVAQAGGETAPGFRLPPFLESASGSYAGPGAARLAAAAVAQQARGVAALARLRPAAVYCNGFRAQVAATLPARVAAAPVVWHVRDFARPGALGSLWSRLAPRAQVILANSSATAGQPALASVAHRVRVAHPGVDRARFGPREGEPGEPLTVGMAGHLTPWKGHLRFLDLVAALRETRPGLRARIAGAPIYRTAGHDEFAAGLAGEIARRGLGDACRVDAVPFGEMPSWLAGLHVLVHCPERPEPFGRSLAEALAVGVPVVSASGGGAPEVVGDAGVMVAPDDPDALREAVTRLLDEPAQRARLGRAGPARVAERFDEGERADELARAILSVT